MYFNSLSIVGLIAATFHLFFAAFVLLGRTRSRPNQVFSLLCLSFGIWAFGFAFKIAAIDIKDIWFWYHVESIGWIFGPSFILGFCYTLTSPKKRRKQITLIAASFFGSALLYAISLEIPLVAVDFVRTPSGWDNVIDPHNIWTWVYIVFSMSSAGTGLYLVLRWGKLSTETHKKKQARVILVFGLPVLLLICVTNVLLQFLGIHYSPGPAPILLVIWDFGILFAIIKYDLMRLDPAGAAEQIIHTMESSLLLVDSKMNIIAANRAAEQLSGQTQEKLMTMNVRDVFPSIELFEGQRIQDIVKDTPIRHEEITIQKDGGTIPLELSATAVTDEHKELTGIVLILRDMTTKKELEFQLLQAMKMDAVGQLAGGLAHDFNNLLVAIMSHSELLMLENSADSSNYESGQIIKGAVQRAIGLTDQLLGFARRGKNQIVRVELHQTVQEVVKLLSRTIDKRIRLTMNLHAENDEILGDPGQIQQVLLNLALNARDAMPDGGHFTIETNTVDLTSEECQKYTNLGPGKYVKLTLTDTGTGIKSVNLQRVFEPFFTTKGPGSGTGMGLAMVYGIVKNHSGDIQVSSEYNKGTTFSLILPVDETERRDSIHEELLDLETGSGNILLIDDEPLVCRVTGRLLDRLGYNVASYISPTEAITYYRDNWKSVDIVILDLVMPELEGYDVFVKLKKLNPTVKVILCSGYALDGKAQQILDIGALCFIKKPFNLEELATSISESLQRNTIEPYSVI